MKELLEDEEHMDAIFLVHPENNSSSSSNNKEDAKMEVDQMIEIRAHKSVLTARAEYFKAFFRTAGAQKGGMAFKESQECTVTVEPVFSEQNIRAVLEFIYTNRIGDIGHVSTDDLLAILHLADKWLLRDLKRLVEHELVRSHLTTETVARLYGATEDFGAKRLSRACIEFIMANLRHLAGNAAFEEEMKNFPHLCIPVLKAAADLIPEGPLHKKQRTGEHQHNNSSAGTPNSAAAAFRSSPVPDSDT
jgi:BTB/POZ domain